jgi:SAM-dependent methyltransferase
MDEQTETTRAAPAVAEAAEAGHMKVYDAAEDDLAVSQYRDPLLRHLTATITGLARRQAPAERYPMAIDIGCGAGRTAMALATAGYTVLGVDPSERVVGLAERWARAEGGAAGRLAFVVGDATAAPPAPWREAYDLAVCSEVIEHVTEPAAVLAFAQAVLRPGGILILTTPHDPAQWTQMDDYAGHVKRFRADELRELLGGFEVLDLATEGFPFQRLVMQGYNRMMAARGAEHQFEAYGHSPAYRAYLALMPALLQVDHAFRGALLGTTLVAVARRP